jgi:hypothetical protein
MFRVLAAGATALLLLVSAAHVYAGGEELLNKKGTLKEKDPGYQPGEGVDKLGDPSAPIIFKIITDNPHQVFKLKLKKGDKVVISLKSDDFDSVVVVESSKKKVLAFNDDDPAGGTLNSKLEWTAPDDDEYRIVATCLDKKYGDFQISVNKAK